MIKATPEGDISKYEAEDLILAIETNGVTALEEDWGLSGPQVISALHLCHSEISDIAEALHQVKWPLLRCLKAAKGVGYDDTARRALGTEYITVGLRKYHS